MNILEKPLAHPSELSRPYWEAAAEGRLVLQRCASCGNLRHYPRLLCDSCYSDAVDWVPASGRGKVHSWTVCHHAFHPGFAAELPYTLVTVDLEEGVRALAAGRAARSASARRCRGASISAPAAPSWYSIRRAEPPEVLVHCFPLSATCDYSYASSFQERWTRRSEMRCRWKLRA